jgi:glycerophosphoryl diester phosphodiesterase
MSKAAALVQPIAHRGLHGRADAAEGPIENTAEAFAAAIAKGYGIECDIRPASCATPMVFHDGTLDRLIEGKGPLLALDAAALKRLRYKGRSTAMIDLGELLELVGGRVPLLVEIKSEWDAPDRRLLANVARLAGAYSGPIGLMSFDPAVMTAIRELDANIARGIVSGSYEGEGWWHGRLSEERAFRLRHLLESRAVAPDFYAYQVGALPTPVTRYVREVAGLPLFTWTVRTPAERAIAAQWADAPIFEGYEP